MTKIAGKFFDPASAAEWQAECQEWFDALDGVLSVHGAESAQGLLMELSRHLADRGIFAGTAALNTPYKNTIALEEEPQYPGDIELEQRIENIIRWNAVAMVLSAFDSGEGLGGHIATYLSIATAMEVGFNHIFQNKSASYGGDQVNFQAHSAPGIYARAFLEGRLTAEQLTAYRRELDVSGGLSSYPHPRRMPEFWEMPTASMGLSTPSSIYQARFAKYLEGRGLKKKNGGKVWTFIGDGESDEPEVLGTINIASREGLDNLVLVINCNLQRLDGPVRGNGKIIQELERAFRGADWHVLKVIWGGGWDPILQRDDKGVLQRRMDDALDGDYQMYSVLPGDAVREHWVESSPELRDLMKTLTDEEIRSITRGGHDHKKLYAAFKVAAEYKDKPCVVLVKTLKGDGLGPSSEGRNTVHQKKQLLPHERVALGRKLGIPLGDEELKKAQLYRPDENSKELQYLKARREYLGGPIPVRKVSCEKLRSPPLSLFKGMLAGSGERELSTTMAMVRMLATLMKDKRLGKYIVPIVPDEARTFGMDGLFAQAGIYSPKGQNYHPVDANSLAPYKETEDGQILQEGICEAGAMASFMAAGTAYATHGLPMVPFYIYYSMFGFQRVGDMVWACGDMLCKGFLLGGTSGRTTLNGEGLQHQDGHSHLIANSIPNLKSYDPAFAYELAVIVQEGISRMYDKQENIFYYITLTNQNYVMPEIPSNNEESDSEAGKNIMTGIIRGMYLYQKSQLQIPVSVNILGSGALMMEALSAAEILTGFGYATQVWSVTSYNELLREALSVERKALIAPRCSQRPYLEELLKLESGIFVAVSDYVKALPQSVSRWIPGSYSVLGTDGFGLSESRSVLRDYFEISAEWIVYASLIALARTGDCKPKQAADYAKQARLDLGKVDPASV
ncbi:MAG: pyruvate dehydrogenase (acetyl-transferring), homodimeric type [Pseudomonadales bacterium]|nr:pyruvate dehydrogenase (acetyl-transferring), homodimeric type [Pseudomonadales bacterium]